MGEEVEQKLKELRDLLHRTIGKETTLISFHLNCEGWRAEITQRTADGLKNDCISMRNIKGDFIN